MSDVLSFNPSRALDANAVNSPGALAYFYDAGTTTLRTVYADSALTVPHASPLVADAAGVFAAVYAGGAAVKAVVQTSAGATLYTLDPCVKVPSSGAGASSVSFAPTVEIPVTDVQAAIERVQTNIVAPLAAFGLGVTGSVSLLASIDATNIASGTYRFDATTTGTYPSGVAAADTGAIEVKRETAGSAWMYLYHDTTDRLYFRRMTASVWGSWREALTANTAFAAGDTLYHNGTNLVRLAKGTALQVLRMNAGATAPEWAASGSLTLLGTLTTTSGSTQTLSGLNLTPYVLVFAVAKGVSATGTTAASFANLNLTGTSASTAYDAFFWIDLASGTGISFNQGSQPQQIGGGSLTNASTSASATLASGTFDAGSIRIYGVK